MIINGTITPQVITADKAAFPAEPLYAPKVAPQRFHAAFDGANWVVFQNEEGDKTNNLAATPMVVKFSCDWDGVSPYFVNKVGNMPAGGIPYMGWPSTDVVPPPPVIVP